MKNVFLLVLLVSVNLMHGQTISQLTFPYLKGYHMYFKGTENQYSQSGLSSTKNSETVYDVKSGVELDGMNTVTFHSAFISGKDTAFDNSPLSLNENGMCYWFADSKGGYQKPVWAIKLPLSEGKTWKTNYGENKAVCKVISMNTTVKLPSGEVNAFCIETIVALGWQNGYQQVEKILDYYNQEIGKVSMTITYYWQSKDGKKVVPTLEVDEVLQQYSGIK